MMKKGLMVQKRTNDRLMNLERTVDTLHGQLRNVEWELRQTKGCSLTERLWKNLSNVRQSEFMSAVCNRRARPNTKVSSHVSTTAGR
jgi:hypothetical protein